MDTPKSNRGQTLCGFCHMGTEVEDVCGQLFTSAECVAHKKCMQYSALLVQYRTIGFGGFKKRKVVDEIKRGRGLACSVCKKKSKSGKKKPPKGATCGCAISSCRRTYHYYCAHNDSEAICRRIEVRYKDTSKASVLYRIFCSAEHQAKFEELNKSEMEIDYNSESSVTEYTSDEDAISYNDHSPEIKSKKVKVTQRNRAQSPATDNEHDLSSNLDDSVEVPTPVSRKQKRSCPQQPQSKRSRTDDDVLGMGDNKERALLLGAGSPQQLKEVPSLKREPLSPSKDITPSRQKEEQQTGADLVLCIMEEEKHMDKFKEQIRQRIAKQFHTHETAVYFWSSQGPYKVSSEHMLYFMRDVAKAVYDSNNDALARLIIKPIEADFETYNQHIQFHQDYMDEELRMLTQERIRNLIGDYFQLRGNEAGEEVGCGFVVPEINSIFIALPLTDQLDPNYTIRRRLPCRELVYPVDISTCLADRKHQPVSETEDESSKDKEFTALSLWLKQQADEPLKVRVRPKEIILRQTTTLSPTCQMCNLFQRRVDGDNSPPSTVAMFLVPVNGEVMHYGAYCRASINAFIKEELTALNPIFCVLDVDDLEGFSRVEDILPTLHNNISVRAFCGVNPEETPASCVILKFYVDV